MPHLVQLDHDGAALWLGFLGVDFGEALDQGLHAGRRHPEQRGGALHRQPAQVEEHRRDLDPERHAARRRGGEVQPAGSAAVALLAAHEPVLDVLLAPAPLAPQRHPFTPSATPTPIDMGNLCGVETLLGKTGSKNLFESAYCAGARIGIGLSSASKPERTPTKARRAAETSSRPARSRARPPQWDSQPKLLSTTQRRASTTKPSACGSRETTRWRIPWTFDHSRQRSAANAPS